MEFGIQTEIEENDFKYLFKWDEQVFPIEGRDFLWSESTHHIIARDHGKPVGHIGFGKYLVVGEAEKNVIGVGGVVVRPEYQGQRLPWKMFEVLNSTDTLGARESVKALFCPGRLVSYYESHGYELYVQGFRFMQKEGYTETDKIRFMVRGGLGMSCALSIPSYPW